MIGGSRIVRVVVGGGAFFVALSLAARGIVSSGWAGALVTSTFVLFLSMCVVRPLSRPGFWLLATQGVIGLPTLGSFGLLDPWETHYGEVAREMLAREDPISTWWAHEGWFTSKPVLLFWCDAIAMRALGVHHEPDRVLEGVLGRAHPEWALRLPSFLAACVGIYVLYRYCAPVVGRRAAWLGAFVVGTSAHWVLLARQNMPDMLLVASLSGCMGLLLAALETADGARPPVVHVALWGRPRALPANMLVAALIAALVLPQILALVSRNVSFVWAPWAHGFAWHRDVWSSGSTGNCDLGGQLPCARQTSVLPWLQPGVQALGWAALTAVLVRGVLREQRHARLLATAAWVLAAVAVMAKGLAGVAIPASVAVVWALCAGRGARLSALVPARALGVIAVLVLPWYVATFARHGSLFFDELVMRHMIGRTLDHLHDTNEGDDVSVRYYIAQLGYGLFPWTGVAAWGLVLVLRSRRATDAWFGLWALVVFALVTAMRTKFHHYVAPAIPPLGMMAGIAMDRAARRVPFNARGASLVGLALGTVVLALVAHDLASRGAIDGQARLLRLFTYQYRRPWPDGVDLRVVIAIAGLAMTALGLALRWRAGRALALAVGAVTSAFLADVYVAQIAPHFGQRAVVDAYYEDRKAHEPLVAYQLNWKGENFYTGNHLALYVSSGPPMQAWVDKLFTRGERTVYFLTEHGRVASLRAELPAWRVTPVTDVRTSQAFVLVRAER